MDYGKLYQNRFSLLFRAYQRFACDLPEEFFSFCEREASWLEVIALFMAEKDDAQRSCLVSVGERNLNQRQTGTGIGTGTAF